MGSRFDPQGAPIRFALGFLLISGTIGTGCINKDGDPLPPGLMSFPIAIELSVDEDAEGKPKYVYVTSSNFALQYNSGNVQSYDLAKMIAAINTGCISGWRKPECALDGYPGDVNAPDCLCDPDTNARCAPVPQGILQSCLDPSFEGDTSDPACVCDPLAPADQDPTVDECVLVPFDRCTVVPFGLQSGDPGDALRLIPVEGLLRGEVEIGSFSDGLGLSTDGRRIYVPVRSDGNLTFIDVNEEGELSCGAPFGERQTCSEAYRSGSAELVNPSEDIVLPPDPVDVYVGDLAADFGSTSDPDDPAYRGDYILMAHREGQASLFFDQFRADGPEPQKRPRLAATVDGLAPEQVTITYEAGSKRAWIPSAEAAAIVRLGIGIDGDPTQSYLFNAGTLFVTGLDNGASNRDIQFDPRPDRDLAYIVSRSPEALVVARTNVAGQNLVMLGQISTCRDPSRLQVAEIPARGGTALLAFVTCFLPRSVQVLDTDFFQGITLLTNISGAFEFVIDRPRLLMYIADFSTSVIRVADLRPLVACLEATSEMPVDECSPQLIGLVGLPQPVSELPR